VFVHVSESLRVVNPDVAAAIPTLTLRLRTGGHLAENLTGIAIVVDVLFVGQLPVSRDRTLVAALKSPALIVATLLTYGDMKAINALRNNRSASKTIFRRTSARLVDHVLTASFYLPGQAYVPRTLRAHRLQ
jgi:hypothetical protein